MDENYKDVYFDQYCKTCKHEKLEDFKDPCNDCLSEPANDGTHRPVYWEEKEK